MLVINLISEALLKSYVLKIVLKVLKAYTSNGGPCIEHIFAEVIIVLLILKTVYFVQKYF